MTHQVVTFNYCTHALNDLIQLLPSIQDHAPRSAQAVQYVIELLQKSNKFILPNCLDIFTNHEPDFDIVELDDLPFPVCAFEASWINTNPNKKSIRRIALCVNLNSAPEFLLNLTQPLPNNGIYIIPIAWTNTGGWQLANGGVFASNEQNIPFVLQPEFIKSTDNSVLENILIDTQDEIFMARHTCAILSCENIKTDILKPLIKNGRSKTNTRHLFNYHVLQIREAKKSRKTKSIYSHLKRGQIQSLDAHNVWVAN